MVRCPASLLRRAVFADEPPQHRFQVQNHPVEIDHLGVDDLPAAEGQQLLGQGRGPVAGLQNVFQVAVKRIVLEDLGPHEFAVARDGHQEIVEIVGHPAGQPAHRLHLLGLEQLPLQGLVLGDIRSHPGKQGDAALVVPDREAPVLNPTHRTVRPDNPVFVAPGDTSLPGRDNFTLDSLPILRMDGLQK